MGDVHPSDVKADLLEQACRAGAGATARPFSARPARRAIEFALKTALLATGKPRVLAFTARTTVWRLARSK